MILTEKEREEDERIRLLEEELSNNEKKKSINEAKKNEVRERSKKILNSLYGI